MINGLVVCKIIQVVTMMQSKREFNNFENSDTVQSSIMYITESITEIIKDFRDRNVLLYNLHGAVKM